MNAGIDKQLKRLEKKEERVIQKGKKRTEKRAQKDAAILDRVQEKIPDKLLVTLNAAFEKGFYTLFEKGTPILEKTYDKKKIFYMHEVKSRLLKEENTKKRLRELDGHAFKTKWSNTAVTAIEGSALGFLGIGLPDIPVFLGMLLKGIYETALSYGFDYESLEEKIYILNLIAGALSEKEERRKKLDELEEHILKGITQENTKEYLRREIKETSAILSENMLAAKFIQGFPVIGAVGGITNVTIYQKVIGYAALRYKKWYLKNL